MKTAIVYYSRTGNTRKAVQLIENKMKEKKIDVDIIEIEAVKKPGFFKAGSASMKQKELPIKNPGYDLKNYDTIIVGTPIWGGMPSPYINTFLSSVKNVKGKTAALFITGAGKPDSHEKAKTCLRQQLKTLDITVNDAFLEFQTAKRKILCGEQQIDDFLKVVTSL